MIIRVFRWMPLISFMAIVVGYNGFVLWRYSKLPRNIHPTSDMFPPHVQKILWNVEFGIDPQEFKPVPFWRLLLGIPRIVGGNWKMPPGLAATSMVARNIIFSDSTRPRSRSLQGHLDGLFMAIWLTKKWSADDISNTILEKVYFCHEFYGIEAAAMGYYGQTVKALTNEELVFLTGIIRSPCATSPWIYPEKAKRRAQYLLKKTNERGEIAVKNDFNECFKRLRSPEKSENGSRILTKQPPSRVESSSN